MNISPFGLGAVRHLLGHAARIALPGIVALALASCSNGGGGGSGTANVRVFNGIYQSSAVTVTVGTTTAATGLAFEGLTTYRAVTAGLQEFKVTPPGATSPILDTSFTLGEGINYSYLLWGTQAAPLGILVPDTPLTTLTTGQFGIRVSNVAFGITSIDLYVTAPGASLDSASPNISTVVVGSSSAFSALTAGSYQLRFTLHNSKQVIYDAGTLPFVSGQSYTIVAYSKASGSLVNAAVLQSDTAGTGAVVNSKISEFKLVHAAPGTAGINTFVNGAVAFANVPYQAITSYGTQAAGTQTVTIDTVTTPGAVIASAQPPFSSATDTSIVLTGLPGAQTILALNDNNFPGTSGSARVRFVNVAPNLGAVDVLVNFANKVSALATNAASGYVELADDTYTINFDLAGTTTVVLSMQGVVVTAGRTYTLYLMGTSGALTGVLTRDD